MNDINLSFVVLRAVSPDPSDDQRYNGDLIVGRDGLRRTWTARIHLNLRENYLCHREQ